MSDRAHSPPAQTNEAVDTQERGKVQSRPDRTRRKLDLSQNKRGAFSVLLGTLSKAKKEDKIRSASEAAQKRALLEKRLNAKLARETISAGRAEQSKRIQGTANKREQELAMKHSLMRHRQQQFPSLAKSLLSSDNTDTDPESLDWKETLSTINPPRRHGAKPTSTRSVIFYKPKILLGWQETLLNKREAAVTKALAEEWKAWQTECSEAREQISRLRKEAEELLKELPAADENDEEMKDAVEPAAVGESQPAE
ncbi:SubName: Full=Uncharacterized protein {ECO:0000313/EMBL:CCA66393.1} [Serendipita indica DSM 11827]|uniref:Pinin/SDK/MemA protein domain-containing protein n=1 Tax=Serendipita indica (strain DSM 11827) TaxID=1109443 RepID=G4T537_SERID|nr:SubName: Full=Uncharacterized protein {ECO:0000313/EMBL:CCA66393.1} [Serendipita indica DSM 11827]CCA66393.1 hypothetical protein PIIN_00079 [Serendipita indica DSM 11827]